MITEIRSVFNRFTEPCIMKIIPLLCIFQDALCHRSSPKHLSNERLISCWGILFNIKRNTAINDALEGGKKNISHIGCSFLRNKPWHLLRDILRPTVKVSVAAEATCVSEDRRDFIATPNSLGRRCRDELSKLETRQSEMRKSERFL